MTEAEAAAAAYMAALNKPKPVVRAAGDAMKLALTRKQSKRLVDQKEAVLSLIQQANALAPPTVEECVAEMKRLEEETDALGLPLTGDEWGERLAIKRKGGGIHFDDAQRAQATRAFQRLGTLHTAVTWHLQLTSRGKQMESAAGAYRAKGGAGASMSRTAVLEKLHEQLTAVSKTIYDILNDGGFARVVGELARLGLPQRLKEDADGVRKQALIIAEFAHETALTELQGLRKESKVTQRFRAPQTLAVLLASERLMRDVDAVARPAASVDPEQLVDLADAIAEVEPMVGSAQKEYDELDDEI